VLDAIGARGSSAKAVSLQGFTPSAGWGFPLVSGALALLGFILPGAFPFQALAYEVDGSLSLEPPPAPLRLPKQTRRLASSRHFGAHPCWVLFPVLQSVKELEK
jgi:hypothetical protein